MAPNGQTPARQHGVKGVYYAGEWLDIEDCDGKFNIDESKCSGCTHKHKCVPPPRSRSANSASENGTDYDVAVIGAGCIGSAIARELSKYKLRTILLESADDVSQGATKGNSGIVHAGYDDKPGSMHAKFCWPGNQMFQDLDRDLRFGYQLNGSLVLAVKDSERPILKELMERGKANGVKNLRIVEKEELFKMEPYANPNAIAALYSPDAGNVIPYEFTIAMAENAVDNGVELRIRREVTAITGNKGNMEIKIRHWEPTSYVKAKESTEWSPLNTGLILAGIIMATLGAQMESHIIAIPAALIVGYVTFKIYGDTVTSSTPLRILVEKAGLPVGGPGYGGGTKVNVEDMKLGGSGSSRIMDGMTVGEEVVRAKYVINCAGGASDKIAKMIGDNSFKIKPRVGDYLLLNRNQGHLAKHTLFPCPDPILGKGVLVQTTLWGNLILGPTARDMHQKDKADMSPEEVQHYILSKCQDLVPSFDPKETIHAFNGARAKSDRGDWIIENSTVDGRMIHVAGIDSPGLAGSPAIALEVIRLLEESGCALVKNPNFNPQRAPIITPKNGMRGLKMGPVGKNDSDGQDEKQMAANVICKYVTFPFLNVFVFVCNGGEEDVCK